MTARSSQYKDYYKFLAEHVVTPFYNKRLASLQSMALAKILRRKNPYLLKAKNISSPDELVRSIVDAFLSSQEEAIFGNLLEGFAIYVSQKLYGGFKSKRASIDLEFARDGEYFIVGIKSGTNWGNADQIAGMKNNFKAARIALRAEGVKDKIIAVNGCIYGKDNNPLKDKRRTRVEGSRVIVEEEADKIYCKYAGQDFWRFISGDDALYREIIRPIDAEARERDDTFKKTYNGKINEMALELGNHFLTKDGQIDWLKLVDYVSQRGVSIALRSDKPNDETKL